jgi:uncharacterized protein (TIGR02246 family)
MTDLPEVIGAGALADVRAIADFIQAVPGAQATVAEFGALFRDDAVWTTARGRRLHGRRAIDGFTAATAHAGSAGSGADYRLERILFLRPDVAVVSVRVRHAGADRAGLPDTAPLYVLSKDDGAWRIAAAQSTAVFDGAERVAQAG